MSEREISQILKNAAPGAPGLPDLGEKVRKGHRRRRAGQGALAALGLVALGVPLALQLSSLGGPTQTTPIPPPVAASPTELPSQTPTEQSPSPEPTASPTDPATPLDQALFAERVMSPVCEDAAGTVSGFPEARIPDGVTRMWLCSNDQEPVVPVYGAPEPIIGDFAEIISLVNDAPARTLPESCETEGDGRFGYVVVLEYPDRDRMVVNTTNVDCLRVVDDGAQTGRGDGLAFFEAVLEKLNVQRQTLDYAFTGDENLCLEATSIVTRSIYDMVHGAACGVDPSSTTPSEGVIRNPIPDDLITRIREEATANAAQPPGQGLPRFSQTIVLTSRHGDPMTMYRWPDGSFFFQEGFTWMAWTPSSELAAEIAPYFDGMRTEMFAEPLEPDVCMNPEVVPAPAFPADADDAGACVMVGDAVYEYHPMPSDYFATFAEEIQANAVEIAAADEPGFTNSWIVLTDQEGRVFQLYVADTGDLVWDTDELMNQNRRLTATPSDQILEWLRGVGVDV
ncbi:hypothetical protein LKO27_00645 [Tessaracoccus sp. OS52]|uniref:hypothetical protein n=1 Tax=Tessaracoccus sp. OS52 TaxID=2886691 RepID=UPI001D1257A0|nr:hypothetical protein [Tessaracoccus sp. OS52]MCC2591939.1 hypothetical protein [Tessaracoccus sp. OS52]